MADETAPAPSGFAPYYYARLAFNIARWDDVSIRRASRDSKAGVYGAFFWAISVTILLFFTLIPQVQRAEDLSRPASIIGLAIGLLFALVAMAILTVAQLGLCHLIAKWLLSATGTFAAVMRPLLLGWFVNLLILIPVIGQLAAAIAWIAVLMLVFEEVDGISRLQAFLISAIVNVSFLFLQFAILP
ncbi:MAG: hypothetical protein ACRD5W_15515 [Candidatus Acidiferrales bacterium]